MRHFTPVLSCMLVVAMATGCATTTVTTDGSRARVGKLAKPGRILVYSFAATTADLAREEQDGMVAEPSRPPSAEQVRAGRQLGSMVAQRLVESINDMGLKAVVGNGAAPPREGDIVIR